MTGPSARGDLLFTGGRAVPAVALTERVNPSMPATLAFSLLLVVGVLLVAEEHVRRGRRPGASEDEPAA